MSSAPPPDPANAAPSPLALAVLALAEGWSDAARAQSIYPPGHQRVAAALDGWSEALDAARSLAGAAPLTIVFTGKGVLAQQTSFEAPADGVLGWLRERLDHAGLAGLRIAPEATPAALAAFDARLLGLYARREPVSEPAEAWADGDWPGLTPLDRRFEGVFESGERATRGAQRTWAGHGAKVDAYDAALLAELLEDAELSKRLARLAAWSARTRGTSGKARGSPADARGAAGPDAKDEDAARVSRRILEHVLRLVPVSALKDPQRTRTMVSELIQTLEDRAREMEESASLATLLRDPQLERRAAWLSSILVREEATRPEPAPTTKPVGPRGHAGDQLVTDDVQAFLDELARLPDSRPQDDPPVELDSEVLSVLLYMLSRPGPTQPAQLLPSLARVLEAPDQACLDVLSNVLGASAQRADGERRPPGLERISEALRSLGHGRLLRECGFLGVERIVEGFPAFFADYVETLDLSQATDRDELRDVLGQIGRERIETHALTLVGPEELGRPGLMDRLLAEPLPFVAPLARVWLRHHGAEQRRCVLTWLRSLRLTDREAQALDLLDDAGALPDGLLLALIDRAAGRPIPEEASGQSVEAIAQFVRTTAGRADRRARRLSALRLLGRYEDPRATEVLRHVVRARRWLVIPVEERICRQVAAETLRAQGAA